MNTIPTLKSRNQIFFIVTKKMIPADIAYLHALESTLSEWHSDNDDGV
jgi:hypothetical protein